MSKAKTSEFYVRCFDGMAGYTIKVQANGEDDAIA